MRLLTHFPELPQTQRWAPTVNYDTSTIIRGIVSTLTPVITQFLLFFFAMIFWMLYADEVKEGVARLFSGDRVGQVARRIPG